MKTPFTFLEVTNFHNFHNIKNQLTYLNTFLLILVSRLARYYATSYRCYYYYDGCLTDFNFYNEQFYIDNGAFDS